MAQTNPKAFLGKGWAFPLPVSPDAASIPVAAFEEKVEQSINLILSTGVGERVMNPEFGSELESMVFEPMVPATAAEISRIVQEALTRWEPRIVVEDVVTTVANEQENRLDVEISYTVSATNNTFNLVFPFFLERE